ADPYASRASNIPADALGSCGGNFPQMDKHGNGATQWAAGNRSWSGNVVVCGDQQLSGDVTIDAPAGAVLIVENGQLDLNGHTLRTSSGSGLTIVFSGSNGSYTHAPTSSVNNSGTIDIAAPTSGAWSGIAVYQDPNLTTGVNMSAAGNA